MTEPPRRHLSTALETLFRDYDGPPFALHLWDGWSWRSSDAEPPACTFRVATAGALHSLLAEGSQVALGEAFLRKEVDVAGDLFSAFAPAEYLLAHPAPLRQRLLRDAVRGVAGLAITLRLGPQHSERRDRESIAYHYDQPIEFFRPWLGRTLAYSCAYFERRDDSLDEAQQQKLDLICRKLRLQAGERFLDVGCGWGSLILHAARHYRVCADGITLSRSQQSVTQQRIDEHRLDGNCRVRLEDYRQLDPTRMSYDKIASVGMFEHVGLANLTTYFGRMYRMLKPGGVFLNHGIARAAHSHSRGNDSFIAQWVFPDSHLVTLTEAVAAAEDAGFEVRDVENLREHYALTLRHWVHALEACRDRLLQVVPERTYRIWMLYMAGCAAAFERGDICVCQMLLSRPHRGRSGLPLTRQDWYAP